MIECVVYKNQSGSCGGKELLQFGVAKDHTGRSRGLELSVVERWELGRHPEMSRTMTGWMWQSWSGRGRAILGFLPK